MLDKLLLLLLLLIASDLCSFCHLGNFLGEITAGRKGNNLYTAGLSWKKVKGSLFEEKRELNISS